VPGRIVKQNNIKVPRSDMDQVDLPDPIMEDITVLQKENSALCNRVIDLERELRELRCKSCKEES
jgi:serine O-acetyltransferase